MLSAGDIAGRMKDAQGVDYAFLLHDGQFTQIDVPAQLPLSAAESTMPAMSPGTISIAMELKLALSCRMDNFTAFLQIPVRVMSGQPWTMAAC